MRHPQLEPALSLRHEVKLAERVSVVVGTMPVSAKDPQQCLRWLDTPRLVLVEAEDDA